MGRAQRYVSDELTHFVGRALPSDDHRFELLVLILRTGLLKGTSGVSSLIKPSEGEVVFMPDGHLDETDRFCAIQRVCFCDIPVPELHLHIDKYGRFGIAFTKPFLVELGANPLMYICYNVPIPSRISRAPRADQFEQVFRELFQLVGRLETVAARGGPSELEGMTRRYRELVWFLITHVLGFVKGFDATRSEDDPQNFYMEREWRVFGHVQFTLADVARVFIPPEYAARLRERVPEYIGQIEFV